MAERYLELAALATSAVPGLDVVEGTEYSYGTHGDFDSALLKDGEGRLLIVRRPASDAAAQEQRAEVRALEAITSGVRSLLPFAVPVVVGASTQGRGLVVTEFIPGEKTDRLPLEPATMLVAEIGRAIAAIHDLPRGFVEEAGLPSLPAREIRDAVSSLVLRAKRTGRLPVAIERRWNDAVDDASLWQFQPSVVHGSLGLGAMITNGLGVVGVLGWSDLRVGDPARDLHWVRSLEPAVQRGVLDEYAEARGSSSDRQVRRRTALYAELEIARWLLHGIDTGDDAVVADAEGMLDALVDRVHEATAGPVVHETLPVLDLDGVQELLGHAPEREAAVRPGLELRDPAPHPDDDDPTDLDHADRDDLSDDTPPSDFLRDGLEEGARRDTGPIIGVAGEEPDTVDDDAVLAGAAPAPRRSVTQPAAAPESVAPPAQIDPAPVDRAPVDPAPAPSHGAADDDRWADTGPVSPDRRRPIAVSEPAAAAEPADEAAGRYSRHGAPGPYAAGRRDRAVPGVLDEEDEDDLVPYDDGDLFDPPRG